MRNDHGGWCSCEEYNYHINFINHNLEHGKMNPKNLRCEVEPKGPD